MCSSFLNKSFSTNPRLNFFRDGVWDPLDPDHIVARISMPSKEVHQRQHDLCLEMFAY